MTFEGFGDDLFFGIVRRGGTMIMRILRTLDDSEDGLRGFELEHADGYVLFFGRPRSLEGAR